MKWQIYSLVPDLSNHVVNLNPAPFLQLAASLHLDLPPSNQQPNSLPCIVFFYNNWIFNNELPQKCFQYLSVSVFNIVVYKSRTFMDF